MNRFNSPKPAQINIFLATAALLTLTGCVGYVESPPVVYQAPIAVVRPVIIEDDYVYYPRYGMYYGSRSHQYYYHDGASWIARPAPRGVSVGVMLASPSVKVDFHDGPAGHHAQIVKTYPKNWKPAPTIRKAGAHEDNKR